MMMTMDERARAIITPIVRSTMELARAMVAGPSESVRAVGASRELAVAADGAIRAGVADARAAGRTWSEIGGALHSSRQSAYQRFGRVEPAGAADAMARAGDRAVAVFIALAAGDFDTVRARFDVTLTAELGAGKLASVWAGVTGSVGRFERLGAPLARTVGDHTVVDVPMVFEAGEMVGRLAFDAADTIAGLFLLNSEALA